MMHEDYSDDDEYDNDDYDQDHPSLNPYKWYYKFDVSNNIPLSKWLNDLISDLMKDDASINNIPGFPVFSFPVTDLNPVYGGNSIYSLPLYMGNNQYNEPIFKTKDFIIDSIKITYVNHLRSHASHFVQQPVYYKGLFDILN